MAPKELKVKERLLLARVHLQLKQQTRLIKPHLLYCLRGPFRRRRLRQAQKAQAQNSLVWRRLQLLHLIPDPPGRSWPPRRKTWNYSHRRRRSHRRLPQLDSLIRQLPQVLQAIRLLRLAPIRLRRWYHQKQRRSSIRLLPLHLRVLRKHLAPAVPVKRLVLRQAYQ